MHSPSVMCGAVMTEMAANNRAMHEVFDVTSHGHVQFIITSTMIERTHTFFLRYFRTRYGKNLLCLSCGNLGVP